MNFRFLSILLVTFFISSSSTSQTTESVPHFIYVYDPLCGWCYGFSPVISQLQDLYADKATFEVIAGGMVRGDRVGPLSDIAEYLQEAYKTVEETTGVQFGQPYLDELFGDADMIMDSEPGCLAQTVINQYKPDQAIAFASAIQKAIYSQGMPPDNQEKIIDLLVAHGIEREVAHNAFSDNTLYQKMINGFSRSEGMDVRGFPTLLLEIDSQRHVLTRGYTDWESLQKRITSIVNSK